MQMNQRINQGNNVKIQNHQVLTKSLLKLHYQMLELRNAPLVTKYEMVSVAFLQQKIKKKRFNIIFLMWNQKQLFLKLNNQLNQI